MEDIYYKVVLTVKLYLNLLIIGVFWWVKMGAKSGEPD